MVYIMDDGKVDVSEMYSEHSKKHFLNGNLLNTLETGKGSKGKLIKDCMKKYASDKKLEIGSIKHSIYGIYTAEILNKP